jgi:hypothetical protein
MQSGKNGIDGCGTSRRRTVKSIATFEAATGPQHQRQVGYYPEKSILQIFTEPVRAAVVRFRKE